MTLELTRISDPNAKHDQFILTCNGNGIDEVEGNSITQYIGSVEELMETATELHTQLTDILETINETLWDKVINESKKKQKKPLEMPTGKED